MTWQETKCDMCKWKVYAFDNAQGKKLLLRHKNIHKREGMNGDGKGNT